MAVPLPCGVLDRIRRHLVGLKMPRALEALDATLRSVEQGELSALEAIEQLLGEELTMRETRRIKTALMTARLAHPQDARRLRLLLPALARPQPHPGPRPARLRRPPRDRPPARPARHRQEPPRHRARRRGGQGRPERLLRHPGRPRRLARPGRARGPACANASASSAAPPC